MSGLLGGHKGQSTTAQRLSAIQISRTAYGDCIPLVYGRTRIPGTLIWYGDFVATPHSDPGSSGGKGGGGGGGSTSYTYSAALAIALCEGPLTSVNAIYADKTQTDTTTLSFTLKTGTGGQSAWSYLTSAHSAQAVPYDHTAYLANSNYQLGSSAAMSNLTYEVTGIAPYDVVHSKFDAACPDILQDYLGDANHGAGFPYLDPNIESGASSFHQYCGAMGFFLSPAEMTQRAASDFVNEICEITNSAPLWSAGVLKLIPHCDASISSGGFSYTANMTPLYDFDDNDYIDDGDALPVKHTRKKPTQRYNKIRVEFLNRANQYNVDIAEASDAADIAANGERVMETLVYHSITLSSVARQVAQLRLQRELYVVNFYEWSVRQDYCLLEPMDLVTLTDSETGLSRQLVRILTVEDDENDNLTFTAEEVPIGNALAPVYNWDDAQGYAANYGIDPGDVSAPSMFSAPPLLISTNGGYELWIAVAGLGAAWGGCTVWTSFDNTTYKKVGVVRGPARYGSLHASLSNVADPDTTSTLSVDMLGPNMQILPATTSDADEARSLIFVDGEIMAYRDATLAATNRYSLGYLRRGKYGSTVASHASGTAFARLDDRIFKIPFDDGNLGKTIYLKFTSFNIYGGAEQSLASVTAYSRTLAAATVSLGSGADGQSVYVQFSADGTTWHDPPYVGTDNYMRIKVGTGAYGPSILITSGATGYKNVFKRAATIPTTPSGSTPSGWSTTPPAADGNPLWYSQAILNPDGSISGSWSTPVQLEGRQGTGSMTLVMSGVDRSGNIIYKTAGTTAWDASAYSVEGFVSAHVAASPAATNTAVMFGLNSDPATSVSYTDIDFAWYLTSGGIAQIYRNGSLIGSYGSYATTDTFTILAHEDAVIFYKNGVVQYTATITPAAAYYFDSSFNSPTAAINNVQFGSAITTSRIGPGAATEIASTLISSVDVYQAGSTPILVGSLTIPAADEAYEAVVTAVGSVDHNLTAGHQSSTFAVIFDFTTSSSIGLTERTIARNPSTTDTRFVGTFQLANRFSVPANTAKTFRLYGQGGNLSAPGSTVLMQNILFKVELIKR